MKKFCLECNERLYGRIDKKYCSDYCRNTFNNRINKDSRNLVRTVNNRLKKNYRLLKELKLNGDLEVSKRKLLDANFDFNHFTSVKITSEGHFHFYVYDIGCIPKENGLYLLHKKE